MSSKDRITKYFLTIMEGETWKTHRSVLSPLFTSGKLRQVLEFFFLLLSEFCFGFCGHLNYCKYICRCVV